MALTIIVEDGSGKSDANSYISLADAETYFESHPYPTGWGSATDSTKDKCLVHAARLFEYLINWLGYKTNGDDQALAWPRSNVWNIDQTGYIDPDSIPQFLKDAQCEQAKNLTNEDVQAAADTEGIEMIKLDVLTIKASTTLSTKILSEDVLRFIMGYGSLKTSMPVKVIPV